MINIIIMSIALATSCTTIGMYNSSSLNELYLWNQKYQKKLSINKDGNYNPDISIKNYLDGEQNEEKIDITRNGVVASCTLIGEITGTLVIQGTTAQFKYSKSSRYGEKDTSKCAQYFLHTETIPIM
ncbi:MAG TPA: hypothetical protein VLB80_02120, partial [Candidatus Babeliales bacterium]|nr:hypothetical protein [Candidatus Babeliales bacterium]